MSDLLNITIAYASALRKCASEVDRKEIEMKTKFKGKICLNGNTIIEFECSKEEDGSCRTANEIVNQIKLLIDELEYENNLEIIEQ